VRHNHRLPRGQNALPRCRVHGTVRSDIAPTPRLVARPRVIAPRMTAAAPRQVLSDCSPALERRHAGVPHRADAQDAVCRDGRGGGVPVGGGHVECGGRLGLFGNPGSTPPGTAQMKSTLAHPLSRALFPAPLVSVFGRRFTPSSPSLGTLGDQRAGPCPRVPRPRPRVRGARGWLHLGRRVVP